MVTKDMQPQISIPWCKVLTSQVNKTRLPSIDRMVWEIALTPIRQAWIKISEILNRPSTRLIRLMEAIGNFHSNRECTCLDKTLLLEIKWSTQALIISMQVNEMQDPLAATMDIRWAKCTAMPLTLPRLSYDSTVKTCPINLEMVQSQLRTRTNC